MITLTDRAVSKIQQFAAQIEGGESKSFRIFLKAGGCSGYSYGFTMDAEKEGDLVVNAGGVRLLVDPKSAPMLLGSTLDYEDGLNGAGFKVENPNAKGSCGCGVSVAF